MAGFEPNDWNEKMGDGRHKAEKLRSLHVRGNPLVLFNIWDPGSAKAVADGGAAALATGSWSVAAAHGVEDGEKMPLKRVLDNALRIVGATELPVSLDIESGYGATSEVVADTLARVVATGVVGCNLEDRLPSDGSMRPRSIQLGRIAAARAAADTAVRGFFLNARTDVFLQAPPETHDAAMARDAVERAKAYAQVGGDGIFVPGVVDERLIETICCASPLPVNVMITDASPSVSRLAGLGVARVSYGPSPFILAMSALREAAHGLFHDRRNNV